MFINCSKCQASVEPALDETTMVEGKVVDTTKVRCSECGDILNVSSFMLRSVASTGKKYRPKVVSQAFAFKCDPCEKPQPAILVKDKALCSVCNTELKITQSMILAMKALKGGLDPV